MVSGIINEASDFSPLLNEVAPLRLDFSGVQRINSIGVRSWMRFLAQWGNEKPIEYLECSTVVVDQLCILGSLRGIQAKIASVKSVFLPTECTSCGYEGELRVTDEDFKKDPTFYKLLGVCPKCSIPLSIGISDISGLWK